MAERSRHDGIEMAIITPRRINFSISHEILKKWHII